MRSKSDPEIVGIAIGAGIVACISVFLLLTVLTKDKPPFPIAREPHTSTILVPVDYTCTTVKETKMMICTGPHVEMK